MSRSCVKQFTGFADDQLKRMTGQKGRGKKGQRPDLESKYGYDVKAGMHALRLLYECQELVSTGNISLPRPERDLLIRIRTGKFTLDKLLVMAKKQLAACEAAARVSSLPETIDREAVSRFLVDSYRVAWDARSKSSHG